MSKKRIKAALFGSHSYGWKWDLPADAESYERMAMQMARAIRNHWTQVPRRPVSCFEVREAKLALRAIGITPPKKGQP